jgi:hypothetical protein
MTSNCKGNALIYVLVAVALMAALTYTISGENSGQQQNRIETSRLQLTATDFLKHVATAEMALYQMTQWGVDLNEVRFDLPGTTPYNSNTAEQIFHPGGGGLQPFDTKPEHFDGNGTTGWSFQGNVNMDDQLCAEINDQLVNDSTIPTSTIDFTNTFTESTTDDPLIATECAACENVKSLCVSDGTTNAFYNIIGSR